MKGKSRYAGIVLTAAVHAALLILLLSADIRSTPSVPPVDGMLIEFTEEDIPEAVEEKPVPVRTAVGVEPRAAEPDPKEEIRLVQKSEAQTVAEAENVNAEATVGEEGDVEINEPLREKPIDRRALFPGSGDKRDTSALQVSDRISDRLQAGHSDGNTAKGNPDGRPTARLEGRTVMGNLPLPEYDVLKSGTVVVRILVDQYGTVTNAVPGVQGTTVQDATLWEAARQAALKAKFNISASAPAIQEGTISYIFTLK